MNNEEIKRSAEYNGLCAFALSLGKSDVKGGDKHALTVNDKIYLFSNPIAKLLFRVLPNRIEKADKKWEKIKAEN